MISDKMPKVSRDSLSELFGVESSTLFSALSPLQPDARAPSKIRKLVLKGDKTAADTARLFKIHPGNRVVTVGSNSITITSTLFEAAFGRLPRPQRPVSTGASHRVWCGEPLRFEARRGCFTRMGRLYRRRMDPDGVERG
jgi:hypothetical protein